MSLSFTAHKRVVPVERKLSTITAGELDIAMKVYQDSMNQHGIPVKAVFEALKSFERNRGLLESKACCQGPTHSNRRSLGRKRS